MSQANRPNRKASDEDLMRLNSAGLSLATIGKTLGCHQTTVTLRLKDLGIQPADTRRAFMEEIYNSLTGPQQDWLIDQLGPHYTIKDFVKTMLIDKWCARRK